MASADQIQFEFMLNNAVNSDDELTPETGLNEKVTASLYEQSAFTQMLNGSYQDDNKGREEKIEHQPRYKEGNQAYRNGDYQKAIDLFTEAITNASSSNLQNNTVLATYYCNRAAAYTMISNFKGALKDYDDAILIDPTFIKAILRKARIYVGLKKYNEARASYLQALELCQRLLCIESDVGQDSRRSLLGTDSTIDSSLECEIKQKIYEINELLLRQVSDATKKINSTLTLKRTDSKRAMKKLRNEKKVEVRKTPSSLSLRRSDSYSRRVEKTVVRKTPSSSSLRRNDSFSRSSDRLRRADSFLRQSVISKFKL